MFAAAAASCSPPLARRTGTLTCICCGVPFGGAVQDENLGLEPPNFNNGRAATAKRSTLAAAVPQQKAVASTAAAVQAKSGTAAALPPVAADSQKQVPAAPTVSSSHNDKDDAGDRGAAVPPSKYPAVPAANTPATHEPPAPQQQQEPAQQPQQEPAAAPPAAAAAAAPVALTGSAAILAKLRSQRASAGSGKSSTANSMAKRDARVTVLYASQTGTGQEIARSIHAECAAQGLPADVMSMNELGFDNLRPDKTPLVVFVASSTGAHAHTHAHRQAPRAGAAVGTCWRQQPPSRS